MNKEILYEILKSKSEKLSAAEIESIMNEELDKSTSTMDTDLIDLCLEALESAEKEQLNKRRIRLKVSKILIAAVIFVLIIGISIPTCAKHFNVTIPKGIVTFYSECFNVDLSQKEYVDDIFSQLESNGIETATLPEMMFYPETEIYNYFVKNLEKSNIISFDFSNTQIEGHVDIQKNPNNFDNTYLNDKATVEFENVDYIEIKGISVLVFGKDNVSCIFYRKNDIEYNITLKCNYKTAYEIAKTI